MAESAFSEDGKYYSAISNDGRLKIWDTETNVLKQQYTPDLHLSAPPCCLQWITVAQTVGQARKQGKKKANVSENEAQCIVLGTTSGKILIYSVSEAKVQTVLEHRSNNKVSALDWHRKYGLFSCCSKDNSVLEWNLERATVRCAYNIAVDNKSKQGNHVGAIKIIPHNLGTKAHYLVTASWQVRLWRLYNKGATIIKTLGHNASQTAVLSLATLKDKCWLIEGSQNERLLSFWDVTITEEHEAQTNGEGVTPSHKKRKLSLTDVPVVNNASYKFVLEDAPRLVDVDLKEEDGAMRLSLVAATRSGVVHYYGHMLNGSSIKPLKPSVTVQASTPLPSPLPLQCCRLWPTGELLIGYINGPLMAFETIKLDFKSKTQVLIRGETKLSKKSKQSQNNETNKVRADLKSADAQLVEPMGGISRKRIAPGAQLEVPMESRLANLSLDVKGMDKTAVNKNFTKLLMQGLHSKDQSILQLVLQKDSYAVAKRTLAKLPPEFVPLLLDELTKMASQKTSLCSAVCTWLHALTLRHGALLLAILASSQADQLSRLLAVFTLRRSHLCQLLNLRGRVELTIKQRAELQSKEEKDERALLNYNDTSSDDDERMLVEKYKSDSDASWGDEKFDSDQNDDEMEQDNNAVSSSDDDDDDDD